MIYMNGIQTTNFSKSTLRRTSPAGEPQGPWQRRSATKLLLGRERRERVPRVLTLHSLAPPGAGTPSSGDGSFNHKLCFLNNGDEKSELNLVLGLTVVLNSKPLSPSDCSG